MKLITRDTDYAARALCYIAQNKDKVIAVRELVKELKMPGPFLRKILQILHKKGILNSLKGNNGGFSLALPAEKIFLTDLISAFQGQFSMNKCIFKKRICPQRSSCLLRHKIDGIERRVVKELECISISSLL